ncbi:DUF998 domain-containing protein [Nocardioides sp. Bht2]|uniref:DUF998 domain-containing protein n=1 Tax=Nocardioides sp. Bht2 TaxID=3392297 RepID=UPI0039B6DDEB
MSERRLVFWGALALLLRPAYVATEIVAAAATTGGYSFVADSVSRLGEVGCSEAFCSPRHELMNGSFVGFGILLIVGAALLHRALGPWARSLLVISGLSSVATGLAPLDQSATLHAIAATPLFVAQPVALLVLGTRLRPGQPRLAAVLTATGFLVAAAALAFVFSGDGTATGILERLALWPVLVALAAFAATTLPRREPAARDRSAQPTKGAVRRRHAQ